MGIRHVIVHASRKIHHMGGTQGAPVRVRGHEAAPGSEMKVSVETLRPKDERDLRRDPKILGTAPVAPMKLHWPRYRGAPETTDPESWGIAAVKAHRTRYDGAGVTVAVLDTGIDAEHVAFAKHDIVVENFTADGPEDAEGHGTHCAGTIFGRDVAGTRIGIAPGIKRALIAKIIGNAGGSSDSLVKAIDWAVNEGAQVVSMSLGMDFPGLVRVYEEDDYPSELATSLALRGYRENVELFGSVVAYHTQTALARKQAIVFVSASGNESRRDERDDYVITVAPPAAADGMLSVGALERGADALVMAPYSNVGCRLCAPGSDIVSARAGGGLTVMSGTSMATPHVAGVAALWAQHLAAQGRLSTRGLLTALEGRATMAGVDAGLSPDEVGVGLVQAPAE